VFTGLVHGVGRIESAERSDDGVRLSVASALADELTEGDSIAVNGVCLTATAIDGGRFAAEVMNETLSRSSLRDAARGTEVNLELPLRAGDRLGGHVVQGHVYAVGTVRTVSEDGFAHLIEIEATGELLRYVVHKGSIAVDGVSLTVNEVAGDTFSVLIIPHTLKVTTLGQLAAGAAVNLEVDLMARYAARLIEAR